MTGPRQTAKRRLCVMVELDTAHPLLDPDRIDNGSAEATAALRQAVVDSLPGLVGVVAVMPVEMGRLMMRAHEQAALEAGITEALRRPPSGYVPPHRKGGR